MKQLIIKDRFIGANDQSPKVVVLIPPSFSVRVCYLPDDKTLRLVLYDDRKGVWHDDLIYKPIIGVSDTVITHLERIKSDKAKLGSVCKFVEELFITDVASFISEDLTPDGKYANAPYFDFALFDNHVNQILEERFAKLEQPTPKK